MTEEMSKTYDFRSVEQRLYQMWEEKRLFQAYQRPFYAQLRPDQETLRHLDPAAQCDR